MANLVTPSDFVNFFAISKSIHITPVIQSYIDRYHDFYIHELLGKDLGDLLIAELPTPTTPRLLALVDPFIEMDNQMVRNSRGMKELILSLVFYHYMADQQNSSTQSGVAIKQIETASINSPETANRFGEKKWNDIMPTWENIQWLCKTKDPATYPEFIGQIITPKFSSIL